MDDEIERLVVSVRADTTAFSRDVSAMRGELEGPLAAGAGRAGRIIETSLARAITSGKFGFDDLKKAALSAMGEIAAASLRGLISPGGGGSGGAGLGSLLAGLGGSLLGLPGRATGGPVSQGRPYLIGERGPELFVPSSAGRVEPLRSGGKDVKVSIALHSSGGSEPQIMRQSSKQIARAVRSAILAGGR